MCLIINHNSLATCTANNLNKHYTDLSSSVQRLSTGLRINSAADDAAGLAIDELQRADIAAMQQGSRNASDAIVRKDNVRAHLGALQNRFENTITNLNIQAENLQNAASRISDVDVATEMTIFVRNQILTQSAVSMLSQANSLPQMAASIIQG